MEPIGQDFIEGEKISKYMKERLSMRKKLLNGFNFVPKYLLLHVFASVKASLELM